MTTTRKKTKEKLESLIMKLESIEMDAIAIGMTYQEADHELAGVMFVVSTLVETTIPLIKEVNDKL